MSRNDTVGNHKTSVTRDSQGTLRVTYHSTTVVEVKDGMVTLRDGGWQSKTTKLRMNQASIQYGLGFSVYQTDFAWFVRTAYDSVAIPFEDGMTFRTPMAIPRAMPYQPKTGQACHCKRGQQRDNCPDCEGTGQRIDFAAIHARKA